MKNTGAREMNVMKYDGTGDCILKGRHVHQNVVIPKRLKLFARRIRRAGKDPDAIGLTFEVEPAVNHGMTAAVVFYPDTLPGHRPRPAEILSRGLGFGFAADVETLEEMCAILQGAIAQMK